MISAQTNTTLEGIAEVLLGSRAFVICGHIHPDGDCIGSTLGLSWVLEKLGKDVVPMLASGDNSGSEFDFLPLYSEMVPADAVSAGTAFQDTVFIGVDVPSLDRLGKSASRVMQSCRMSIIIDHHDYEKRIADLSYTDPDATSTTLLIWRLCKHLGVDSSEDDLSPLAACLYTGLLTDSNCFTNSNVGAGTFEAAAEMAASGADPAFISMQLFQRRTYASILMDAKASQNARIVKRKAAPSYAISFLSREDIDDAGATYDDMDNCINVLRSLADVDIVCLLKAGEGIVRGSMRSKDGTDVSRLAGMLGGGGHKAAAGFTVNGSMEDAVSAAEDVLNRS